MNKYKRKNWVKMNLHCLLFYTTTNLRYFVNNLEQKRMFAKRKCYSNIDKIISLYFQSSAANCDIYKGHKFTGELLKHIHTCMYMYFGFLR